MTLATHAVIATALAKHLGRANPILGFFIGWVSHYLGDLIPHWDYYLYLMPGDEYPKRNSKPKNHKLRDYSFITLDVLLGTIISLLAFRPHNMAGFVFVLASAFGGMFPDFLQFLYSILKLKILKPLQDFQNWSHTKIKLGPYPLIGVPFQIIIFLAAVYFIL